MLDPETLKTIEELKPLCFGSYLFGTVWGILSLIIGFVAGVFFSLRGE